MVDCLEDPSIHGAEIRLSCRDIRCCTTTLYIRTSDVKIVFGVGGALDRQQCYPYVVSIYLARQRGVGDLVLYVTSRVLKSLSFA